MRDNKHSASVSAFRAPIAAVSLRKEWLQPTARGAFRSSRVPHLLMRSSAEDNAELPRFSVEDFYAMEDKANDLAATAGESLNITFVTSNKRKLREVRTCAHASHLTSPHPWTHAAQ